MIKYDKKTYIFLDEIQNVNEFEKYAVTVENLSIPEQTRIVALGEATQGNDIRFYGFDMQRREYNYQYLLEAVKNAEMDVFLSPDITDM